MTDNTGTIAVDFDADATVGLTLALLDYDACSFDAAVARMTALIPTLTSSFGDTLDPEYLLNCLQVASASAAPGSAINQSLALSETTLLAAYNYYDDSDAEDYLRMTPVDVPAGLSVALQFDPVTGAPTVHLTGTKPLGTYLITVLFYIFFDEFDEVEIFGSPTLSTLSLVVEPQLAATGTDPNPLLISSALTLLAGVALVAGVSRRRWGAR